MTESADNWKMKERKRSNDKSNQLKFTSIQASRINTPSKFTSNKKS